MGRVEKRYDALPGRGVEPWPRNGFERPPGHVAMATYGARRETGIVEKGAKPIVSLTSPFLVIQSTPTSTPPPGEAFFRRFTRQRLRASALRNSTSPSSLMIRGRATSTARSASALASKVSASQLDCGSADSRCATTARPFALPASRFAKSQAVSPARNQRRRCASTSVRSTPPTTRDHSSSVGRSVVGIRMITKGRPSEADTTAAPFAAA